MSTLKSFRRAAKLLKRAHQAGDVEAVDRVKAALPGRMTLAALTHADALHVIAHEAGHASWPKLKLDVETRQMDQAARAERLKLALYLGQHWVADALLSADPSLARANLGLACALYDVEAVTAAIAHDPAVVHQPVAGPRVPLLHLCGSKHFRNGGDAEAMMACARALRAAGADVDVGFPAEPDSPHLLSALYLALGHADNLGLAAWLLDEGATPDDDESLYHATELGHLDGVRLLLEHGVTIAGTNALPRMLDFNNLEGVRLLLEAGADPNEGVMPHPSGAPTLTIPALHQAARRMCGRPIVELLLAHGADGTTQYNGHSAYAMARIYGNQAVAAALQEAGQSTQLDPVEDMLARAAEGPVNGRIQPEALTEETRRLLGRLMGFGAKLDHLKRLVALGFDPDWTDEMDMPAIHIAAWEGLAPVVDWLLTLEPDLNVKNAYGGDLMGTVLHGAENAPARDHRDHLACTKAILAAGAPLHRSEIVHTGLPQIQSVLEDWAERYPDRVVEDL